ncbi:hypothetical protein BU197_25775 [Streptomyces sp. CBMA291]|nr:hypothetical protein [Streptomyces sp. CBMA291]
MGAGEPALEVGAEGDGDPVEARDAAEDGSGVDVVGEQPGGGGEDAGAEVAARELAELADEDGRAERRQVGADQGDPVAFEQAPDDAQTSLDGGRVGGGADDDHVPVAGEELLHVGEGGVERAVLGGRQDGRLRGPGVGRGQHQIGAGDRDRCRHVGPPVPVGLPPPGGRGSLTASTASPRAAVASAPYPRHPGW